MDIKEWQKACKEGKATVRHHLMDTPEQIEYNKNHYEMWGHNLDGTFEYGKYMIFVTPEEHSKIHSKSEITRKKISEANKGRLVGENNPFYGKHHTEESINKIREAQEQYWTEEKRLEQSNKLSGENSPWYGRHHTDETKEKISNAKKGVPMSAEHKANWVKSIQSEETREKLRNSHLGDKNPMYGKHPSEETRKKLGTAIRASRTDEVKLKIGNSSRERMIKIKEAYSVYKKQGGKLLWNDFQKEFSVTNGNVEVINDDK